MSIEEYERLSSRHELYTLLMESLADEHYGRVEPFAEAMKEIRAGQTTPPASP